MPTTPTCACPLDSKVQLLSKINNNLIALFKSMSAGVFLGNLVTIVGNGCGCSEKQILATINNNIASAFLVLGLGTPDTIGATTNNAGNSTITPASAHHVEIITVGGAARTSVFILDVAGRNEGDRLELRFAQPATANIVEEVRNATAGGTLIYTYTTDGSGSDVLAAELYFDGAAWRALSNAVPVV